MTRGEGNMLPRRAVLAAGAALAASPAAWAQDAGRIYRLGFATQSPRNALYFVVLLEELRRAGFVEGGNLAIVGEFGVALDRTDAVAAAVVKAGPDVFYMTGPIGTRAVQRATTTIPIVAVSEDLVSEHLVASLAHPGGNTTGVSVLTTELDGKRQDLLIELLPGIGRLAVLVDPGTTDPARLPALVEAAGSKGVTLSIHRAGRVEDIGPAIEAARAAGAQALNVLSSVLLYLNRRQIIEHVAMARLPAIYQFPEYAEEGGLVGYGARLTSIYGRQLAPIIVKLLRGAKPADIPVEQPSVFDLAINLKTAKALGLAVPTNFLVRADKVIE